MMAYFLKFFSFGIFVGLTMTLLPNTTSALSPSVIVTPNAPSQGEPLMISVSGATLDQVAKIIWNNRSLWFFNYQNRPTAIVGIDLGAKTGNQSIKILFENGETLTKIVTISAREKIKAPLGIPQKLGGNTPQAQTNLVSNLTKENLSINNLLSANKRFWSESFRYPTSAPKITDAYGYLRQTGYYAIPHKGTDFQAKTGTDIYAINRGVVRLAKKFEVYGNTVAIDHGLGIISYYMHLSKINVTAGELVNRGQLIGKSGETGYALSPHLHLSIKIKGISIDPAKFLELF